MLLSHVTGEESETLRLNDLPSDQPAPACQAPEPLLLTALLLTPLATCPLSTAAHDMGTEFWVSDLQKEALTLPSALTSFCQRVSQQPHVTLPLF